MKNYLFAACSLLTLSLYAGEDDWTLNNSFAVWGEVAFFRRSSEGSNHRLIIDKGEGPFNSCGSCDFSACDSKDLMKRWHYEPGFRVGTAYMSRHTWLEATYLWVDEWSSDCYRNNPGLLFFSEDHPHYTSDFFQANTASAHYKSRLRNGELNYYRYVTPRKGNYFSAAWLVGARYIFLADDLDIVFHKGSNRSCYNINTWNHEYLLQTGIGVSWNPTKVLSWDLFIKLGTGLGYNKQHTFLGDFNNSIVLRNYNKERYTAPFFTDVGLTLAYQPWKFVDIHIAYQMIYLNATANAPNQIVKRPSHDHHLRTNGYALIHGGTAGITFSF